jgi:biopolymer transport protein ExbD
VNLPSPRARRKARIEIIPLIDIVFFLLATFVMVSLSMVKNQSIAVSLPSGSSAQSESRKEEPLVVAVSAGNEIFLGKMRVRPDRLKAELSARAKADKPSGVLVRADKSASVETLVKVLDAAKQSGLQKLGVAVEHGD